MIETKSVIFDKSTKSLNGTDKEMLTIKMKNNERAKDALVYDYTENLEKNRNKK